MKCEFEDIILQMKRVLLHLMYECIKKISWNNWNYLTITWLYFITNNCLTAVQNMFKYTVLSLKFLKIAPNILTFLKL